MKGYSTLARTALVLVCLFCLIATVSAADRPAKQNRDYTPKAAATQFPFVATGVVVKIKSASIANDGTITTRFTVTDSNNAGIDINGVYSPGSLGLAFVAAYIPNGKSQYTAYTTSLTKASSNSNPPQLEAGTDSGGKYTLVDPLTGTYDYVFGTKATAGFDATATHSIGMQGERDLSALGYPTTFTSNDVFTFVPNGSAVTNVRDVINEASCNGCHDPLNAHGNPGPRTKMAFCVLCHTPQSTNPDSLNTVDMKVFIHKLHMGSSLPSVVAGGKYFVVHRGTVQDYSTIVFPQDARNCTTCHAAGTTQADNWKTNPSRAVCGSCHYNVNFATGLNHVDLPQVDDNQCKNCHNSKAYMEFDASIPGAHTVPNNSTTLPGIVMKVLKVVNNTPGSSPTITFQVMDKAGNPVDISKLTRLRINLAGPNVDYQTGPGAVMITEDASKTPGTNGVYTYTMTGKIPAAAVGSYTVSLEARNDVTLMAGTLQAVAATDAAKPVENYFSADNSPLVARRQVVADAKCGACHQNLVFIHGGTRNGTQECVICHNPSLADGTSKQSVNFAVQIHSIHRGDALANPYILGTTNFQDLRFPGDLRDCTTCHVNNSYQVDNVGAKALVNSPGGFLPSTAPISAACQGCHDDKPTAAHALANTSALGESCVTCHGIGAEFAVDTVHARIH
jgi:OmcA/MtrC family decaheme c-type cytochrome